MRRIRLYVRDERKERGHLKSIYKIPFPGRDKERPKTLLFDAFLFKLCKVSIIFKT